MSINDADYKQYFVYLRIIKYEWNFHGFQNMKI